MLRTTGNSRVSGYSAGPQHPFTTTATSTMGRKRNRLGLVSIASALALSVSAVNAFQTALPNHTPLHARSRGPASLLNVLAEPEVLLREDMDIDFRRLEFGMTEQLQTRTPPKVRAKKKNAKTKSAKKVKVVMMGEENAPAQLPPKEPKPAKKTPSSTFTTPGRQWSPNQMSTMPGFSSGSMTGRQKAFRDGVRMVEGRTGKKFVDTPEQRKKRRQMNGEAMYKTSAAVPDSLVQFAADIHKIERITPKEEVELGEKTQEAIRLQALHDGLTSQLNRPPTDDEWCAAAGKINLESLSQALDEGLEAKNKLVSSNLRMVQGVVNLYIRNGLGGQYNAGDLMQEGIVALVRAAEKFDPNRGFRFSTYAMYWIRSAVKRSQVIQSRVITVPQRLYENHKRILRTEREMRGSLGRKPTQKELAEAVGMSVVQMERCITAMDQRCFSLDQNIHNIKKPLSGEEDKETMIEIIASRTDDGDYHKQRRIFFREDLINTLRRNLKPEEATLLLLRYGLCDDLPPEYGTGPMTIAAVSRLVGLKPDKVRRMINKSLRQLEFTMGNEWLDYERELQQ